MHAVSRCNFKQILLSVQRHINALIDPLATSNTEPGSNRAICPNIFVLKVRLRGVKVLLSLYKENTNYWLPIIHSFGFRAGEGHALSISYSKKESGSNDILYIL